VAVQDAQEQFVIPDINGQKLKKNNTPEKLTHNKRQILHINLGQSARLYDMFSVASSALIINHLSKR
jgi:hypothetical protein